MMGLNGRALLLMLLLTFSSAALADDGPLDGRNGPERFDGRGQPGGSGGDAVEGPRSRPTPEQQAPLGFAEAQRVLSSAVSITRALTAGDPVVILTPQGQRLTVPLSYQGQVVSRAFLTSDGRLAALQRAPMLPESVPVTAVLKTRIKTQVQALSVSGAVQSNRGEYRVTLLSAGVPVAALRLDRSTLQPKPDDGMLGHPIRPGPHPRP